MPKNALKKSFNFLKSRNDVHKTKLMYGNAHSSFDSATKK